MAQRTGLDQFEVNVRAGGVDLEGTLTIPEGATALVIFAHGSGSSRFSSRNRFVAEALNEARLTTLLFDLLTARESVIDERTAELRFDIDLLAERVVGTIDWARGHDSTRDMRIGLFGASTGAAAALVAASQRPDDVGAVVSRGGRPDLAGNALPVVQAPTLLIVGGRDGPVIEMNREAAARMKAEVRLDIIPGATHLFEEAGTLEEVARLARQWFADHLTSGT